VKIHPKVGALRKSGQAKLPLWVEIFQVMLVAGFGGSMRLANDDHGEGGWRKARRIKPR
jgi:hypothetical protein